MALLSVAADKGRGEPEFLVVGPGYFEREIGKVPIELIEGAGQFGFVGYRGRHLEFVGVNSSPNGYRDTLS